MNKYIKDLVNTYYLNEKLKYDNGIHYKYKPSFLNVIYENFHEIDNSALDLLNEEYHILTLFDEVLDSIEKLYILNKPNALTLIYTGYSIIYEDTNIKVIKCSENANNIYPIYIKIIDDDISPVYAAVLDLRDLIIIEINSYRINKDTILLRSACKHEFLHIREKYAKENLDVLQNKKNLVPTDIDLVFLWDNKFRYEFNAGKFCNIILPSEIRARINAFAEYIKHNSYISFNECLEKTNEITLFFDIFDIIKKLELFNNTNNYAALEVYMYYCQKYSIVHTKYKMFSFKYRKPISKYSEDEKLIMEAFILELLNICILYKINLQKQYYKVKN